MNLCLTQKDWVCYQCQNKLPGVCELAVCSYPLSWGKEFISEKFQFQTLKLSFLASSSLAPCIVLCPIIVWTFLSPHILAMFVCKRFFFENKVLSLHLGHFTQTSKRFLTGSWEFLIVFLENGSCQCVLSTSWWVLPRPGASSSADT